MVGAIKAGSAPDVTLALRPYVADYLQTDYVVNLEPVSYTPLPAKRRTVWISRISVAGTAM